MCGICGAIHQRPGGVAELVARQLDTQTHRGPDAKGSFANGRGAIAQNRLSIIDLVTGDPPMTNEDGTIGAVLNGEIYNFQSIRDELARGGHQFHSRGDTETLAHLAETLPAVELAMRLDGMFAFATWDTQRERLLIGRDRMGKKPLYYWCDRESLVFASEIKGVLAHPAVPRRLNERAISAYLTFGYVPTPETFFEGIYSLPPAHTLTYEPGASPVVERYWRLPVPGLQGSDTTGLDITMAEASAEVRRLLEASIRRRLISDVPLGAFLSGGIDSSAIVAVMAAALGEPVKTFTIGFDDATGFDERPYARLVADRFGTEHLERVVPAQTIDLVERLVYHHDQPFGDSSAIPTFLLNEVAREHVTVALSGDGGDELFAGYERFAAGVSVDKVMALPSTFRALVRGGINRLPPQSLGGRAVRAQRFFQFVDEGLPDAYLDWVSYTPEVWRRRLLANPDSWARDLYREQWNATAGAKTLDRLLTLNIETYLVDDLLVKMDRTSMAHGLEVRSPFLDTALVEFAALLPPVLKVRGMTLKGVLKRAVADLLPPEILKRRKRGFSVPLDRWFRDDLKTYTASMLGSEARVRAHVQPDALDALMLQHMGGASHGHTLWSLLTLEAFLRRHDW